VNEDRWLAALAAGLRRRGVREEDARLVVEETVTHLRDSGEPPDRVFGSPDSYAAAIAESVGAGGPPQRTGGGVPSVRLRAAGITKRYGGRTVLDGVDFEVRAGEVAAVVGANGCGKTTFLRICAGLLSPDAGEVWVDGSVGYCPQDGGTYDFLTAEEHFVLVGAGSGLPRRRARERGRRGASRLHWDTSPPMLARALSSGTRQKLNLVMSTLGDPDVLLLDEPYQGFDRGTYVDFWDQVFQWRDGGSAVVVVTHLLNRTDQADVVLDLTTADESADGSASEGAA
jgi:ABC-2 type transport system ATP-binding protein